ncbi:tetratricopeptide repeat protein [Parashewanella tropica]|uniref:tetratricopeptide repeat protein n=1 Tax=Parashewanella tropica TaxID=2547970 RepID=UPI0010594FB5|nr:SEL1-like repeat protein [Parashewanella tropica]
MRFFAFLLSAVFSTSLFAFPIPQPEQERVLTRVAMIQLNAAQGNKDAEYAYGLLLLSGKYLPKDVNTGFEWLKKAADHGHEKAQKTVADLAFDGKFIKRDLSLAQKWYSKNSSPYTHFRLGFIYAVGGDGIKRNCTKAADEFLLAGDKNAKSNAVWVWSTCPDKNARNAKQAIKLGLELYKRYPNDFIVLDNLAAAYAEAGEFDKAVNYQRQAIANLQKTKEKTDLDGLIKRLSLYQNKQPYREVLELP